MVQASDQGTPERTETVNVQVNVRRNEFLPEFEGEFDRSIDVNHAVNATPVVVVRAVDRDKVVSMTGEIIVGVWLHWIGDLA